MNKSLEARTGGYNSIDALRQNGFASEGDHADIMVISHPKNDTYLKVESVRIFDCLNGTDFTLHKPVGKKGREAARQAAKALPVNGDIFTPRKPMADGGA